MQDINVITDHAEYYAKVKNLEEQFSAERVKLSEFIEENILSQLNDIKGVPTIQVHAASQRQRLTDKISNVKSIIRQQTEKQLAHRKVLFFKYKTEYNVRLGTDSEINRHIDADLEHISHYTTVLENQIDFYKRTIEGIDKIGFMVKYLIEYTKFINGGY